MRARDDAIRELLDEETFDEATLKRNLRDIRHINALLCWRTFAVRAVARHVRALGRRDFSLLDVACGSADIPRAIARWAQRTGVTARIVACDLSPLPSSRIWRASAVTCWSSTPRARGSPTWARGRSRVGCGWTR